MNALESAAVNSTARRALQRFFELSWLIRLGGRLDGGRALEIGCGSGYGTQLIIERMGAASVDAVDPDPRMVDRARRRLRRHANVVRIVHGDALDLGGALGAEGGSYDAAFDFAVLHHIEDWRAALDEVARTLRPGGRFYFVEVTSAALARPTYDRLFDHPEHDRFAAGQLLAELSRHGLDVGPRWRTFIGSDYVLGVARRAGPSASGPE
ncbi:class I SAM-dependent methyltransferase [Actinotalea ferrariae]|nr:class I SAM-dependent methyltransferase [Actinotalea ferrariae]